MLNLEHIRNNDDMLNDAFIQRSYGPQQLKVYDDYFGDLFVYGHEFGPTMLIRAQSWESAYSIAIDESVSIDNSELFEAYGFDNKSDYDNQVDTDCSELELIKGYTYQDNSTGTGIVCNGHYEWMTELNDYNNIRCGFDTITPVYIAD